MRLRNIPNADKILNSSKRVIKTSDDLYNDNTKQLELEIGMGKGDFILAHAIKNPDINFIGIEKYPSVQLIALNKIERENNLNNLKLLSIDAINLPELFEPKTVDKIYLNFSDPWPKTRHHKRRLTYKSFLDVYHSILKDEGLIEIKTDQKPLYNFTLDQVDIYDGFDVIETSLDLHGWKTNIITTEYEKRFIKKGNPIFYIKLKKNK